MTRRILVVDDNLEITELTRLTLEGGGFAVTVANDGVAGLELAASGTFSLMLLDINMPGIDGWAVLRRLHAEFGPRRLPVVLFSVRNGIHDKVHALQEGAYDYIEKPFSPADLLARVERILASLEVAN